MVIRDYLAEKRGVVLSDQQAQAVVAPAGQVLLLAVPGAGKTTVVTAHAAHLIQNKKVPPQGLLILTYNRSAAKDMQRRWERFFGDDIPEAPKFSTIHSFCYRLLGEYARLRGTHMPRLLEGEDTGGKSRILGGIYKEITGRFLAEDALSRIQNLLGYCVNMRQSPQEVAVGEAAELECFAELAQRYTSWKRENDCMDFDDMQLFAHTALARSPALRERFALRYSHVLVDEAQDTSRLQQELIGLLTRDNLFMVGDEDQSIYGFRGAYPQGLLDFFKRYPKALLLKLEQNYRSTPEIVAAAGKLIAANTLRYPKNLFTARPSGSGVQVVSAVPMERQYRTIAEECAKMAKTGSCAVLYRTSLSAIGVATELAGLGVAYSASESRMGYTTDFVTRDISNILRLVQDPGNAQAFRQVYFRLGCGINRETEKLAAAAPREDILGWLIDSADRDDRSTARMMFVRRTLARMAKKTPTLQVDDIMEELGYLDTLEKRGPAGYTTSSYLQRLTIIRRFAVDCDTDAALLERLATAEKLLVTPRIPGQPRPRIRLSTVHSAKGQEYDHVIIADALEGIFPAGDVVEYSSLNQKEPMEEETRLFYTAMTRAKNSLTIYAPGEGFGRELLAGRFLPMAGLGEGELLSVGLREGADISHTFFGAGVITEMNRQRKLVTVNFRHYGLKTFAMDTLQDKSLFKLFQ